jgi:hypothetical protein
MTADKLRQNLDKTLGIKEIRQPVAYIAYLTSLNESSLKRTSFLIKPILFTRLSAPSSLYIDYLDSLKTLQIIKNTLIIYISTTLFY